jgi:hypothetical protein
VANQQLTWPKQATHLADTSGSRLAPYTLQAVLLLLPVQYICVLMYYYSPFAVKLAIFGSHLAGTSG